MDDTAIIELYWSRDEQAIVQTRQRYGKRLMHIAFNILKNREDAEESESDTYFRTWNAIPPQRPTYFFAFLSRICRNIAFDRLDWNNTGKRSWSRTRTRIRPVILPRRMRSMSGLRWRRTTDRSLP